MTFGARLQSRGEFSSSGVRFHWSFQASTDLLCRIADEDVRTLAASGVNHIGFGTESASPEVLRGMNKAHQRIPDMFEAARKCKQAGIRVTYNLIFGYPGEEDRHRRETLKVMGEIAERFDNVSFSPNVFTPYPGIPIWPRLRSLGLKEPQSLSDWASIDLGTSQLPWMRDKSFSSLQRGISYFLLDNQINKTRRKSGSRALQTMLQAARRPLHWRIRNSSFALAAGALAFDGQAVAGSKTLSTHRAAVEQRTCESAVNPHGRRPAHSQQSPLLRSEAGSQNAAVSAAPDAAWRLRCCASEASAWRCLTRR